MNADDLMTRINEAKNKLQSAKDSLPRPGDSQIIEGSQVINELNYSRSDEALLRMHQEMISNLDDIDKMRFFNSLSGTGISLPALAEFAYRVRSGGEWDHKPMLRDELGLNPDKKPGTTGDEDWYFPIEGNSQDEYNYDIWSNIHYGYVGRAAGFSPIELRGGADLADGGRMPSDDLSVRIGMELWEKHGSNLTEDQLRQAIIDHTDEYKQLQTEENTAVITPDDEKWNGE
ncbi:polymorphic toxin type 44 domain-containing protein [Phormidesmis sp. 146-35]